MVGENLQRTYPHLTKWDYWGVPETIWKSECVFLSFKLQWTFVMFWVITVTGCDRWGCIQLTGGAVCCHRFAFIVQQADSHNRDGVKGPRLEIVHQEPVVLGSMSFQGENTEVVLVWLHVVWRGPCDIDGVHSLWHHGEGARRVWDCSGGPPLLLSYRSIFCVVI